MSAFGRLLALQQGNWAALVAAQRSALEGLVELCQWPAPLPLPAPPRDAGSAIAAPIDAARAALEQGTAQAHAVLEIAGRRNAEVAEILRSRTLDALEEWRGLLLAAGGLGR
ncbi:hypothetical protein [Siccirubricoccus phaeus]|uniref:hypothetical protein n=1 Tax=Siccirubricoccus phaeus TaxID=2595053 RepID=UPI0011F33182|nr:hypothetical protein [Siccirubricoccus phaeus]